MQQARAISWQGTGATPVLARVRLAPHDKGRVPPWVGAPNVYPIQCADSLQDDRSARDITDAPSRHAWGMPEVNHAPLAQWGGRAQRGGEPRAHLHQFRSPKTNKGNVRHVP